MSAEPAPWGDMAPHELERQLADLEAEEADLELGEVVDLYPATAPDDLVEPRDDGLRRDDGAVPKTLRTIALAVWDEAERNGDDDWRRMETAERAAYVAGRVMWAAGAPESLARAGFTGPGAVARYLDAVEVLRDPAAAAAARASIGWRTALDLDYGPAPPQLAEPFIAARGVTIIYGKGGTGKGITTAHLVCRLVRSGHVVMILDYEGHPEEWGSRLRGLGLTDDELRRGIYREPYGPDWTAGKGPLRDVAHLVREDAAAFGVTVVVVDSYTTATSTGDTMGGAAAAQEFFAGCAMIGLPTLVLAHVRGEAGRFPEKPFGSVFVHNLARETWAIEALDPDDADPENQFAPEIVRLELRNMKRNRGGKRPPVLLTFAFHADASIIVTDETAGRCSLADTLETILDEPMTVAQIGAAILDDTGEKHPRGAIRSALLRNPTRFMADASKRPHRWNRRP
ncbi:MAG: AAA family ATPase [Chloroflexi bacterium]|nr:AAA family ATPase [Chloroflexota bacterium]